MVGACGAGIVTPEGIHENGVGMLVLAGKQISAVTAQVRFSPEAPEKTGEYLGEELLAGGAPSSGTVFVFPDGLAGNISRMLRGLYGVMGPDFQYVGGGTGDNLRFRRTFQFTEDGVASGAVAAALVSGVSFGIGIGIGHGWKPIGSPLIITRANGKTVYEFDERPAFEVYSERLGGITQEDFAEYGMHHPLGIIDASGRFIIRDPLRVGPMGSLELVTEVPPRAVAYLMSAEVEALGALGREVCSQGMEKAKVPRFMLVFNCVSRFILGQNHDEVAVLRSAGGASLPLVGLLTFGEVAAYNDVPLFHNKTLVVAVGGQ